MGHREGNQVQELGSRDENLKAAIDFTEKGLHILVNKGDDQVTVLHRNSKVEHAIPTEMRLKDPSGAIIPFEDLKLENNMSDARCDVCSDKCLRAHSDASSWDIQASAHVAGRIVHEPVHVPARKLQLSKLSGERVGQRAKAFWCEECHLDSGPLRAVGLCEPPTEIRRGKMGVAKCLLEPNETAAVDDGAGTQ